MKTQRDSYCNCDKEFISKSSKTFIKPNTSDEDSKNEPRNSEIQSMFDFDSESKQDSMNEFNIKTIPILSKFEIVSMNF